METLVEDDVRFITTSLPKSVDDALRGQPGVFLAGGFIRAKIAHEEVSDIDLFAASKMAALTLIRRIANGAQVHETDNAFTYRQRGGLPVQGIHRWVFDSPIECLKSFDFTIARAAVWWDGLVWKSACDPLFYPHLAAKRLVYCSPDRNEDAGGSLLRLLKFYRRGYSAPLSTTGAVIARLMRAVREDDPKWQGTEADRAAVLTGLLREVDPLLASRE